MRIAVNTRLLLSGKLDGIGWFTYHTLSRITREHPEIEFIFFFDRKWSEEFVFSSNVTPVALSPQARHPFLYYLWFEHAVPNALKKHKADLFLSPDGYLSLSTHVKQLSVIHDLNFEHYPKDLPFLTRNYYLHYFPRFARKADRIATVSEFSKNDINEKYKIDLEKIDVVYNGVNEMYAPLSAELQQSVRSQYTNNCNYFLFVGMLHQRKNIARLLNAFESFKNKTNSETKLLIVGHKKWWTSEMESAYNAMEFKSDVIFLGRISIEELNKITASALAMVYVSVFEGFGVPILESMRCGVPVITSDTSSMPEVSGGAALLVDPFNSDSIAEGMISISKDENLRISLAGKGLVRSKEFTWDKTAGLLWDSMAKII